MTQKTLCAAILFLLMSLTSFSQNLPVQTDSMRLAVCRSEIGLDMSVPDFETKQIDSKVMGARLAGILDYMMDNYAQMVYSKKICRILKEQVEPLGNLEFELKKLQFVAATKNGDDITLRFTVWLDKNPARVKRTELVLRFKNGVSDSHATNELFCMISRYVQRKEELDSK